MSEYCCGRCSNRTNSEQESLREVSNAWADTVLRWKAGVDVANVLGGNSFEQQLVRRANDEIFFKDKSELIRQLRSDRLTTTPQTFLQILKDFFGRR